MEFPPISHLLNWPELAFGINKIVLIFFLGVVATMVLFIAGGKKRLVPKGAQTISELSIEFINGQVIGQTMGPDGARYLPFLLTMFMFIFFTNITEIIPIIQFPANARMAIPALLAIMVWFIYNIVGVMKQGPLGYLKSSLFPPGVPKALYLLVTPIEFVSTFLVRPFSLAVRLFANMLAGHLLLVTFAVMTAALFTKSLLIVIMPVSFVVFVGLMAFEILVSFLQAFIFTILTAVYIGGAMHPEH